MHSTLGLFGVAALAAVASATQHVVEVGQGGLHFVPNNTVAEKGDTVVFIFNPKNHTVTQGSFTTPCAVGNVTGGAFFSDFVPVANGTSPKGFEVTVGVSTPIWFYCSQGNGNHCQNGMVGSINAPATGNTLDLYAANSKKTKSSEIPPGGAHGGTFIDVSGANGSDSGSGSGSGSDSGSGSGSGSSTGVSSAPGSASTLAYNGGSPSGSSPTNVASSSVTTSTAISTGPAQQTKNAAVSLVACGWRELFGLVAAAAGVVAYMA